MTKEPDVQIEEITPARAAKLLEANGHNRIIKKPLVERYATMMRNGEWSLTGEAIKVSAAGRLLDGQHRLLACVAAEVPFRTVVIRGVAEEAMPVLDTGLSRTPGDTLRMVGVGDGYYNQFAAIARQSLLYQANRVTDGPWGSKTITRRDLIDFCTKHDEELRLIIPLARQAWERVGLNLTSTSTVYVCTAEKETFVDFIDEVISGIGLLTGSPALALRNWLGGRSVRLMSDRLVQLSAVIRAFNGVLRNEELRLLKPWAAGKTFPRLDR